MIHLLKNYHYDNWHDQGAFVPVYHYTSFIRPQEKERKNSQYTFQR